MTGPGTNTYLVGEKELAVIDPGPQDSSHLHAILTEGAGRIRWILCSHTHLDHAAAAMALAKATGAPIAAMSSPCTEHDSALVLDRSLQDGDVIELDGTSIRTVSTPGHASNQVCFLLESTGMLFTGDHIMQGSTVVIWPPDGNMAAYLRSLRRLLALDIAVLAPGHGYLIDNPAAEVERLIQHRLSRENKVRQALRKAGGQATLEALLPVVYDDVSPSLYPIAARSLQAHLEKLIEDQEVIAQKALGIFLLAGVLTYAGSVREARSAETMHASAIDKAGDSSVLTLHTLPVPKPDANEVLIAVDTAGVAVWDIGVRRHPNEIKHSSFPLVLGTDGAGTIAAVGSGVHGFKVGDRVYSYSWDNPKGGFYAEYVAVPAERVGHIPTGLNLTEAGAMGTTALTALQGVDDALHLKSGQTVIIHGASGGVGSLAVQFAKLRGARVLATASGEDGAAFVKKLGADVVVDSRTGDIAAAARKFSPDGIDAVLALAGGESLERCIDTLRHGGQVAFPNGVEPPKKRTGLSPIAYDAVAGVAEYERLNQAIQQSHLRVPIAAEYPLVDAAKAQQRVEAGHILGKVVLRMH
jgi:NADPH2:quinone reductase